METLLASLAALAVALLAGGIAGLVRLSNKVERLIAVVEEHVKSDERRFQRLEDHAWPQSRAR
jgi:hypothetical protein